MSLPPFPVDDATLSAVEHALGGSLSMDAEDGGSLDAPVRVGADYGLHELLDFLAGCTGREGMYRVDSDGEPMTPEQAERDDALGLPQTWIDERPHYSEHDLIQALIDEVRRLRGDTVVEHPKEGQTP